MKKIISALLTFSLLIIACVGLTACGESTDTTKINVGYMSGPTGIGMAQLIATNGGVEGNDAYSFEKFEDTSAAAAALQTGSLDVACLPTNEVAKLYNTAEIDIQVLAINCLNALYVVAKSGVEINSFADLEGKTVYTCTNGTPKIILEKLIAEYGINVTVKTELGEGDSATVLAKPQDLPAVIAAGKADIVIAPEPIVTNALMKNTDYSVKVDLGEAWDSKFETPIAMGCIVARKSFVDEHASLVNKFLSEYKASIEFMSNSENIETAATYAVDTTIMGAVPAAKKALTNLGDTIAYVDGSKMKTFLENSYNAFGLNIIGGKMPDDAFYYVQ
ncbi:MAG: ABC transporter substrate-binding protein [Clostridia bacterium]|nr:ABC transporter substrate-binding protein [Clostridia bacterium]